MDIMPVDFIENPEKLLANATNFLIQGQEFNEASILLLCEINVELWNENYNLKELRIFLTCNRAIYDIIQVNENPSTIAIRKAFNAVLPYDYCVESFYGIVQLDDFNSDWRTKMLAMIEGKMPLNQCLPIQEKPRHSWAYLLFRSPVEITIAQTLDKYRVLFLPNCMARLGLPGARENKEADFLVCYEGKWGILEINGDTYHVNSAKDHNRGRLFKLHGIKVFEPYEASRCVKEPDKVVQEFLELVKRNG
jgi:hypothetical protein